MVFNKLLLLVLIIICSSFQTVNCEEYTVDTGDVIKVAVYGEPDLTIQIKLNKQGQLSMPFVGDLLISGKTTEEVEKLVDNKLRGDYLIDPQVTVSIVTYRPFYINGQVRMPGGYPYEVDLTLDKAIAIAGGLTQRASDSDWIIQREVDGKIIEMQGDISSEIKPDDVIRIGRSFF